MEFSGADDNALLERPFWSSLTVKPPLYGADTPHSLFDDKLDFGWNLRNLKCLLSKYKVPAIPGVTTPMTYFGMWKVCMVPLTVLIPASCIKSCIACTVPARLFGWLGVWFMACFGMQMWLEACCTPVYHLHV